MTDDLAEFTWSDVASLPTSGIGAKHWANKQRFQERMRKFIEIKRKMIETNIPPSLMDDAMAKGWVNWEDVLRYQNELPEWVYGPHLLGEANGPSAIQAQASWFKRKGGFFGMAGEFVDYVGRIPGYEAAYRTEVLRLKKLSQDLGVKIGEQDLNRQARRIAERHIINYVDTPTNRTKVDMIMRSVIPFVDSHVRFWKRWGKIALRNPGYVEKSRLLVGIGEQEGYLERNEYGDLVGNFPIVSQLFQVMSSAVVGNAAMDWFKVSYDRRQEEIQGVTGDINDMAQSLIVPRGVPFWTDLFPGWSPMITMPVDWLTANRPNFEFVQKAFLGGPINAERMDVRKGFFDNVFAHFNISWVGKVFNVFHGDDYRDASFMGSVVDALNYEVYSRSTDEQIWTPSSREELEELLETARNKAKFMWFMRGSMQAWSPFTPTAFPFGKAQADKWREYRQEYGPEEGSAKFIEEYGERAFGWTIGKSKNVITTYEGKQIGGPAIAASQEAEDFYDANREFFRDHPYVAGFFTRDMEGEFDNGFWREQILKGSREPLPPREWWADMMYKLGNRKYFDEIKPVYNELLARGNVGNDVATAWLAQQRDLIDQEFPGWKSQYGDWSARLTMRQDTLADLRMAIERPEVAEMKGTEPIRLFINAYDTALGRANQMGFKTLTAGAVAPLRQVLSRYARELQDRYGSRTFESVYQYLFQYELEEAEV